MRKILENLKLLNFFDYLFRLKLIKNNNECVFIYFLF
jgi:hypothetical protein